MPQKHGLKEVKSHEGWKEISSVIKIKPRSGSTKIASDERALLK